MICDDKTGYDVLAVPNTYSDIDHDVYLNHTVRRRWRSVRALPRATTVNNPYAHMT